MSIREYFNEIATPNKPVKLSYTIKFSDGEKYTILHEIIFLRESDISKERIVQNITSGYIEIPIVENLKFEILNKVL
jgi:hypothetical protein